MSRALKFAAALFLAGALLVPAAAAEPPVQTASIKVSHADLNLASRAGASTLLRRMERATIKVCGERPSPRLIQATARHAACTHSAMKDAVAALNVQTVTALFEGRAGTEMAAR